jgi:hypothetical protein
MDRDRARINELMRPADRDLVAKVRLEPSGCHRAIIAVVGSGVSFEFSKVEALKTMELLQQCVREMDTDDLRPSDREFMVTKGVEV